MSDTPQGPDWFQATDGKWYPPANQQQPQFAGQKQGSKAKGCLTIIGGAVVGLILLIIIIAVVGGSSSKKSTTTTTAAGGAAVSHQAPSSANSADADVSITGCTTDAELHLATANLTVLNHSSKASNYSITVAILTPDGSQFDTANAFVQTLAAGQTATTTAQSLKSDPPSGFSCKVTAVTRFAS